jgi:hypothetical protein
MGAASAEQSLRLTAGERPRRKTMETKPPLVLCGATQDPQVFQGKSQ